MAPEARKRFDAGQWATCEPRRHQARQLARPPGGRRARTPSAGRGRRRGRRHRCSPTRPGRGAPPPRSRRGPRRGASASTRRWRGELGRGAQHVGRAGDRKARRDRVAQPAVVAAMPSVDQVRALAEGRLEDLGVGDGRVVAQAIHHHLADHRPDPVRLGGLEGRIQGVLVDGAVEQHGGRAGSGKGTEGRRGEPLRGGTVEGPLEREDVALEPGQQVEPRAAPDIGQLRQMGVQVDHSGHHDPRPDVDRLRSVPCAHLADAPVRRDADQGVRLPSVTAAGERGEQTRSQRKWTSVGQKGAAHAPMLPAGR